MAKRIKLESIVQVTMPDQKSLVQDGERIYYNEHLTTCIVLQIDKNRPAGDYYECHQLYSLGCNYIICWLTREEIKKIL